MINSQMILIAFLGGVLPALVWLGFWLREDRKKPEPKGLILRTFVFGMLGVFLVLPFQKAVDNFFPGMAFLAILLWALAEESFKFVAAYFGGLKSPEDNEPIDPLIYMITAALGFVSLENALFIATPLIENDVVAGIITGNMRFIGASLLHTVSSGIVGIALAFSFYKTRAKKLLFLVLGLTGAIFFHTIFNMLIVIKEEGGTLLAFGCVWVGIIWLILTFERVKKIAP